MTCRPSRRTGPISPAAATASFVRRMVSERRVIVTNDIADFQAIHDQLLAAGDEHHGMIFTFDATMPRTKDAIPQWVQTLSKLLADGDEDSLRNRVHHLP